MTRMLAKEPEARFATAGEIREILEQPLPDGGTLAGAVDKVAVGGRAKENRGNAGEDAAIPASCHAARTPTQSTLHKPTEIQNPKFKSALPRPALAAFCGGGHPRRVDSGEGSGGKSRRRFRPQAVASSTAVLPVSQKTPVFVPKVTPSGEAGSIPHSDRGTEKTGSLVGKAGGLEAQHSTSGSLPTPAKPSAPNNPLPTPALTAKQLAELEALRREQQEELALLRSLRQQITAKSAPTANAPATSTSANPSVEAGKTLPTPKKSAARSALRATHNQIR